MYVGGVVKLKYHWKVCPRGKVGKLLIIGLVVGLIVGLVILVVLVASLVLV
jgi:hypothetical protein